MTEGSQPAALDDRLQRLVDESDIRALISRFARLLDERRWKDYAALYTDDGTLELPFGRAEGRERIQQWAEAELGRYCATQHVGGAVDIEFDAGTVIVHATLLATHVASEDGRAFWTGGGWYALTLRREGGRWLFATVAARPSWVLDVGGAFPRPDGL
jgi:ketosteroid isomerase-like protein